MPFEQLHKNKPIEQRPISVIEIAGCCSADVYYGVARIQTAEAAERITEKFKRDRDRGFGVRATLSLITSIECRQAGIDRMKELGWNVLQTWKSCHGDYPVTLFGFVHEAFNLEEHEKNPPVGLWDFPADDERDDGDGEIEFLEDELEDVDPF